MDLLNLNVPAKATEDTEVVMTRLARKIFRTSVQERFDPRGRPYYWIDGDLICSEAAGTDVTSRLSGWEDICNASDP